jgi:uncharacterized protein (DUF433 family)
MDISELLKRITIDPEILTGKPIIRGMRVSVEQILDLLSQGATEEELLQDYPMLEREDILACLAYAKKLVAGEEIEFLEQKAS